MLILGMSWRDLAVEALFCCLGAGRTTFLVVTAAGGKRGTHWRQREVEHQQQQKEETRSVEEEQAAQQEDLRGGGIGDGKIFLSMSMAAISWRKGKQMRRTWSS